MTMRSKERMLWRAGDVRDTSPITFWENELHSTTADSFDFPPSDGSLFSFCEM